MRQLLGAFGLFLFVVGIYHVAGISGYTLMTTFGLVIYINAKCGKE